jgi:hypothetical protein
MNEELSGLDLIGLLEQLEPIPEPALVSLWPQTAGWLWVGLLVFGLAVWLIRRSLRRHRANRYRRAALREIGAASGSPAALAEILRRTALAAFPRTAVAGLYGDEWLAFLDRTGGLDRPGAGCDFREGVGRAFAQAPYAREMAESADLAALAKRWVLGHRTDAEAEP